MKDVSQNDVEKNIPLVARKHPNDYTVVKLPYGNAIGGDSITVIAGPCVVESLDQIMDVALNVKKAGATAMRGGVYKPLTFPYVKNFKLPSHSKRDGYRYLQQAGEKHALPTASEVGSIEDVATVATYVDVLQVGARNMQHFPLLEEAGKKGKPVLLKRHPGMSLRDWLGAAEWIAYQGNTNIILCERGISAPHTHNPNSRFLPDIAAIHYAKRHSHLPVVYDPSHSTFDRDAVPYMAKAAVAAGADGILIDVHPEPEKAAVDPLQALNYETFGKLMEELKGIAKAIGRKL
jgi:3-deoxy-7-phosphoheptulonate synthase